MDTLHQIQSRLDSVDDLRGIVRAMRSLAATRIQQAEAGLESIRAYTTITAGAISDVLAMLSEEISPAPHAKMAPALCVLTSEHGFVGALNNRLLSDAAQAWRQEGATVMIVGSRGAAIATEMQLEFSWTIPMASHGPGVEPVARRIADEVYRCYGRHDVGQIDLLYPSTTGAVDARPERTTLLPFVPAKRSGQIVRRLPLSNEPAKSLFAAVVQEHVFAEITRAVMETLASVNRARLMAMQSAYDNLDRKARILRMRERRVRQEEITTELLDVVTGAEAIGSPEI